MTGGHWEKGTHPTLCHHRVHTFPHLHIPSVNYLKFNLLRTALFRAPHHVRHAVEGGRGATYLGPRGWPVSPSPAAPPHSVPRCTRRSSWALPRGSRGCRAGSNPGTQSSLRAQRKVTEHCHGLFFSCFLLCKQRQEHKSYHYSEYSDNPPNKERGRVEGSPWGGQRLPCHCRTRRARHGANSSESSVPTRKRTATEEVVRGTGEGTRTG